MTSVDSQEAAWHLLVGDLGEVHVGRERYDDRAPNRARSDHVSS